jgi:hypothetical protein
MKLHRDFKRSHKALVLALTMYEKTQKAEISRLGAVGWSERQDDDEDFYTKAMKDRQAELDKINRSMHQVNDVYKDLGFLVQKQQEPIDKLEENTDEARAYTESATRSTWDEILCFANEGAFCNDQNGVTGAWKIRGTDIHLPAPMCGDLGFSSSKEDVTSVSASKHRETTVVTPEKPIIASDSEESPRGVAEPMQESERSIWFNPLGHVTSEIQAVHNDIVHFGTELSNEMMKMTETSK